MASAVTIGHRLRRLAVVALVAGLTAASGTAAAPEPYEINVILSQTGSAAFLGSEEATSLQILEGVVNKNGGIGGRPVKFAIQDDQSNPQVAVQLFNGIAAKKVPLILGSSIVATCSAMAAIAKDGPVIYCFSPGIHPAPGYLYSASISTLDLLTASARYLRERSLKKIAIVTTTDATGQEGERTIDAAFATPDGAGETIVAREHMNVSDISVAAQLARIKESGAQAVIAWVTGTPLGTVLRAALEVGVEVPILTSSGNLSYPELRGFSSFVPRELLFPASPGDAPDELPGGAMKNAVAAFAAAFKAAGTRPDQGHTLAWDPALIAVEALKKAGPNASPAQIKAYLDAFHDWSGINGRYDFRAVPQRGLGPGNVIVVKWNAPSDSWSGVSKLGGDAVK
jgi:branched-chain amino acid transport system substrate-binding protein